MNNNKLASIEFSRGIAALLVVLYHATGLISAKLHIIPLHGFFMFGASGVDFFFVLSGFIIFHVHRYDIGHPDKIAPYIRKRLIRVFPVYWVVLAVIIPIYFIVPSFGAPYDRGLRVILSSIFLIPLPSHRPVLAVAWTLCYEFFFYAIFVLLLFKRKSGYIFLGVWLSAIVVNVLLGERVSYPLSFVCNAYNLEFMMGLTIAIAINRVRDNWIILLVGILGFFITGMMQTHGVLESNISLRIMYGTASAMIILGAVPLELQGAIKLPRWAILLGASSYSIYLVHYPFLSALAKVTAHFRLSPDLLLLLLASLSVVCGVSFHVWVERPLLMLLRGRPDPSIAVAQSI